MGAESLVGPFGKPESFTGHLWCHGYDRSDIGNMTLHREHSSVFVSLSYPPGREQCKTITADDASAKKNNPMEKSMFPFENASLNLQGSLTLTFNFIILTI